MKKFELKFWLSCVMMALCIGFTACSDDDEEGIAGDAKTLIVGTWESTWSKGYEIYEGEKEEWDEAYTEDVYTFKNDGSGTYKMYQEALPIRRTSPGAFPETNLKSLSTVIAMKLPSKL